jgi:hypothetical protein
MAEEVDRAESLQMRSADVRDLREVEDAKGKQVLPFSASAFKRGAFSYLNDFLATVPSLV